MKRLTYLFSVVFVAILFSAVNVQAQDNSIVIDNAETFFVVNNENSTVTCQFILKGLDEHYNTKSMTETILAMPGVVKFGVKNTTTDKYDEREAFLILKKETYKNVFPQVMTQMQVNKVKAGDKEYTVNTFIAEDKK